MCQLIIQQINQIYTKRSPHVFVPNEWTFGYYEESDCFFQNWSHSATDFFTCILWLCYAGMAVSVWTISPRVDRTKRYTLMFSPMAAILCLTKSFTEILSSLLKGFSRRASSPNFFEILPSTFFSLMFSGFEARSSLCISSSFCWSKP